MTLDPDGCGDQWLYRGMGVQKQDHPKLLPYAAYDWERDGFLIGVCMTKKSAKKMIDKYILDGKNAIGYVVTL
jgi:hypothetical protein